MLRDLASPNILPSKIEDLRKLHLYLSYEIVID